MPDSDAILSGLETVANEWRWLAVTWHGFFAVLILAFISGLRVSRRMAGLLLTLPVISVSALAWLSDNPFNGIAFTVIAVILLSISAYLSKQPVLAARGRDAIVGGAVTLFGFAYPHFLHASGAWEYLYASPLGLVPCPTLSTVIGISLWTRGLESGAWCIVLAAAGLFYGTFGAVVLDVPLDWILSVAALIILPVAIYGKRL